MAATENQEDRPLRRGWTTGACATVKSTLRDAPVSADIVIVNRQRGVVARDG